MAFDEERQIQWWLTGNIEGLVAAMLTAQRTVKEGTDGISGAFGSMGGSVNKFIGVFGTLTGVVAGGAAFKAIVSETNSWNLEAMKLSKTLGITTQEASVLNLALGDVYLSIDTMQAASALLTRNSLKNAEAFAHYGIALKDANGEQRSTLAIMADVNDKLLSIKEGRDREIAGMQLYGRGWTEISGIIKLNGEVMREAQEKAERLHLIVGPEGVEKTKKYRAAMNDLEDVTKSVKVQVGNELLPVLAELGAQMEGPATRAAGVLAGALEGVNEAIKKYKKEGSGGWKNFLVPFQPVDPNAWKDMSDMTMAGVPLPGARKSGQSGVTPYEKNTTTETDQTDELYKRYSVELTNLNKKIAESNPYLNEHEKAMAGVYAEVLKLSAEMPQYIKSWNAYGAAMEQNIGLNAQIQASREAHDQYLAFYLEAQDINRQALINIRDTKAEIAGLRAEGIGDDKGAENTRFQREQEKLFDEYVLKVQHANQLGMDITTIYEEYETRQELNHERHLQRMEQYDSLFDRSRREGIAQRTRFDQMAWDSQAQYTVSTLVGMTNAVANSNKTMFMVNKTFRIGEAMMEGYAGAIKTWNAWPYPWNIPMTAAHVAVSAMQIADLAGAGYSGSGSSPGGNYGGGTPTSPIVTQPIANQQPPVPANTTIVLKGIPNGKWIEEELIPGLDEAGRRNIRIEYVPA